MKKYFLIAAACLSANVASALDLGGEWKVSGDGFAGAAQLPGTLAEAGFGERQSYETWSRIKDCVEKGALRLSHVYRGKAVWSRTVDVPVELEGKPLEVFLELRGQTLAPMMPEDEAKDEDGVVQGMGGEAAR